MSDPLLINAAQTARPGRGWWRNLLDLYGAADILVAEVQLQRLYPGGPARARFIARHGPDNQIVGGFTLTAPNSDAIPAMMAQGVQRMDQLFAHALAAGAAVARSVAQSAAAAADAGTARREADREAGADEQRLSGAGHRHRREHVQFRDGASANAGGHRLRNAAADQRERARATFSSTTMATSASLQPHCRRVVGLWRLPGPY